MEMTINSYGNDNKQQGKLQEIAMEMTTNSIGNDSKQLWK